jgi:magnesium chelatase family protein
MIESSQATIETRTAEVVHAVAHSTTLIGLDAVSVAIEVNVIRGPARFAVTAIDEAAERETRVRVTAALTGLGVTLAHHAVAVHFAGPTPSHPGSADLAIALAILGALGAISPASLENVIVLGELSLSGDVRPVRGALAHVLGARALGYERAIVPAFNGNEAGAAAGMTVHLATSLGAVVAHLNGEHAMPVAATSAAEGDSATAQDRFDLADVHGLSLACRVLEIAAAGNHNVLLVGPIGSGKTMLARRLPTILPPLTEEEAITVTMIHSVAGLLPSDAQIVRSRPFRAPHHTVSETGLLGGGRPMRPGELSLAHHGVLYLDELPEFRRSTLDALPAILERGDVILRRSGGLQGKFPAHPLLIASAEPCPASNHRQVAWCDCLPERVAAYRSRLAALTLRTFDLRATLAGIGVHGPAADSSAVVRQRVIAARAARTERASGRFNTVSASLDAPSAKLIADAVAQLKLSGAEYSKVLRVARTIADLDGSTPITSAHAEEALSMSILSTFAEGGTR